MPLTARALLLALLVAAGPAAAGDGVYEIHQACVATGCFPGDAPGFPVTTQEGKSYVLTSDLAIPSADLDGVVVDYRSTLDMAGFSVTGVTSCTGMPATCTGTGSGFGIALQPGASVRGGSVRKMGGIGIRVSARTRVEDMLIEQNGEHGIRDTLGGDAESGFWIEGNIVRQNGSTGIEVGNGAVVRDNVVLGNGSYGIGSNASLFSGNTAVRNDQMGLAAGGDDAPSGYVQNLAFDNVLSDVSGNLSPLGANVCGADTVCP